MEFFTEQIKKTDIFFGEPGGPLSKYDKPLLVSCPCFEVMPF
jgi:hypothetical protein